MSEEGDDDSPYKPGNRRSDGSYKVGKNRPPEHGKFREGDGRKRGRRPKGTKNFDTLLAQEAARLVSVTENGKIRKVPKGHAAIIRLLDNAYGKGQNAALDLLLRRLERLAEKAERSPSGAPENDLALVEAFLRERTQSLAPKARKRGKPSPIKSSKRQPSQRSESDVD